MIKRTAFITVATLVLLLPAGLLVSVTAATGVLLVAILLARRSPHDQPMAASVVATLATAQAAIPWIPAIPVRVAIPDDGPIPNVRPLPPMRELIPPVNPALLDDGRAEDEPRATSDEEGIPRWLRPSVREARFANDRDHRRSSWG